TTARETKVAVDTPRTPIPQVKTTVTAPPVTAPPAKPDVESPSAVSELTALITEYGKAISTRDIAAIRALYPTITAEQQRGFEAFFGAVRELRANLSLASPIVEANSASGQVTGTYEYTDASGKAVRQPVSF